MRASMMKVSRVAGSVQSMSEASWVPPTSTPISRAWGMADNPTQGAHPSCVCVEGPLSPEAGCDKERFIWGSGHGAWGTSSASFFRLFLGEGVLCSRASRGRRKLWRTRTASTTEDRSSITDAEF